MDRRRRIVVTEVRRLSRPLSPPRLLFLHPSLKLTASSSLPLLPSLFPFRVEKQNEFRSSPVKGDDDDDEIDIEIEGRLSKRCWNSLYLL